MFATVPNPIPARMKGLKKPDDGTTPEGPPPAE